MPSPTVPHSASLGLGPRICVYTVIVVILLLQDHTLGTSGLVESSLLLPGMLFSSTSLAFRFCHLNNLALGICSVSLASAYFFVSECPLALASKLLEGSPISFWECWVDNKEAMGLWALGLIESLDDCEYSFLLGLGLLLGAVDPAWHGCGWEALHSSVLFMDSLGVPFWS